MANDNFALGIGVVAGLGYLFTRMKDDKEEFREEEWSPRFYRKKKALKKARKQTHDAEMIYRKYKGRKGPALSATSVKRGTRRRGNDGNMWEVRKSGKSQRWFKGAESFEAESTGERCPNCDGGMIMGDTVSTWVEWCDKDCGWDMDTDTSEYNAESFSAENWKEYVQEDGKLYVIPKWGSWSINTKEHLGYGSGGRRWVCKDVIPDTDYGISGYQWPSDRSCKRCLKWSEHNDYHLITMKDDEDVWEYYHYDKKGLRAESFEAPMLMCGVCGKDEFFICRECGNCPSCKCDPDCLDQKNAESFDAENTLCQRCGVEYAEAIKPMSLCRDCYIYYAESFEAEGEEFYVVVKKEGQVMANVIHRTFNLEEAIDYAERLWSDGIYEEVEVDCPDAETVVWMNGEWEDAWLELNAESFEAESDRLTGYAYLDCSECAGPGGEYPMGRMEPIRTTDEDGNPYIIGFGCDGCGHTHWVMSESDDREEESLRPNIT